MIPTGEQPRFPGGEVPRRWLDRSQVLEGRRLYWMGRRAQDLVLSAAALALLWPLMGLVALAIWLDSPGASPIFVQDRVGPGRPAVPVLQVPVDGARRRGPAG